MFRRICPLLGAIALLLITSAPALAAKNVVHYPLAFTEEGSMPLDDASDCVGYAGTIFERRTYDLRVTEFVAGPNEGMVHLTGVIWGEFRITPGAGESGPTYEGSYREKVTLSGDSLDTPRVVSFVLPLTGIGSDGSTLKLLLHGHAVMGRDGEVKLEKYSSKCIR